MTCGSTRRRPSDCSARPTRCVSSQLIAELSRRTEGWAASLQLVHAALHDRDAAGIRAFIRSLSGAEGHLYDYLAEEVVGDLSDELQDFLMKTSLLDTVDLVLGPVAAGVPRRSGGG